ncbi:MAG: hypothetical protein K0U98_12820 [Deltaproteobacteria bacterium]|nr:hypothetical protein [Deltaproteobacteria bacterium]
MPFPLRPSLAVACVLLSLPATESAAQIPPENASGDCAFSLDKTPALGVPSSLWGELEPTDIGQLPGSRDTTDFDQGEDFEPFPYWFSLDIEEGWLFALANRRLQLWDARTSPNKPILRANVGATALIQQGMTWGPDPHAFYLFRDIDAPEGDSDHVALVGQNHIGLVVFDTTNKTQPRFKYQDRGNGRNAAEVYTNRIGDRAYAFAAAETGPGGVFAYDLTAAAALPTPCVDQQPGSTSPCPGVFLGPVGDRSNALAVDGVETFLAIASGHFPTGLEIWDVANPRNPEPLLAGLDSEDVYGVALWRQGPSYLLSVRTLEEALVFDVTCIATGPCSLPAPIWSQEMVRSPTGTVTDSLSDGTPFLYFGSRNDCQEGNQNEWLFEMNDPTSPRDVTPPGTVVINGEPISYWGWYYSANGIHGFNRVAPRMGKFAERYFYRAGHSVLDVHRWNAPNAPIPFFADGFESGDTSRWTSTTNQ